MWNSFIINKIAAFLKSKLKEARVGEIFTQNRNELVITFYYPDKTEFYWTLNLEPSFPHLKFTEQFSRARKNTVDLFEEIYDQRIAKLVPHENERSFHFLFENGAILVFKLHDRRSNVILINSAEVRLFRSNLENDYDFRIPDPIEFGLPFSHISDKSELKSKYPFFDKIVMEYLDNAGFYDKNSDEQKILIQEIQLMAEGQKVFMFRFRSDWVLHVIRTTEEYKSFENIADAVNEYSSLAGREKFLESRRDVYLKQFRTIEKKIVASLEKMKSRLEELKNSNRWEEEANIIMANLHSFGNTDVAELYDFYNNRHITINIKRGQTAQKYAENLYRKSKNKAIEIKKLSEAILNKEKEQEINTLRIEELIHIEDGRQLRDWIKTNIPKDSERQADAPIFREFELENYRIYVGRNSKNNDELTTRFASKDDIWLHAKDVSGSHVLVKRKGKEKLPGHILETAASIAAWYSKGKNDTLFPVIYTERKYVRKGKGLAAGQVLVDKYDVIMVKPGIPE